MNRRPMIRVLGLALLSVAGLVGMLLIGSPGGDAAALLLAAAPLLYGALRVWRVGRHRVNRS